MKQISLRKNFIMNAVLTISTIVFPLITFPYISRILLAGGVGKVSFATSVISYFCIISELGIPTYGIRACARVRDDKLMLTRTVHELLLINLVTTLISYCLLAVGILCIPKFMEARALLAIISATMLLNTVGMEWLYKALEQYTYITIRSIIFKVIAVIAMFLLVKSEGDTLIYGTISIFASSASNIVNLCGAGRIIGLKPVGGYHVRRHIQATVIFFAMTCASTIYTNLDLVMLGFMKDDTVVGYYTAAIKVKTVLVAFITSLGAVLLPRVSYYVENKMQEEFAGVCRKAMNFVAVSAIPLMVYFIFYAREAVTLLSGEEFLPAAVPMQFIMPTIVFIGITNILGLEIMVPLGREKQVLISVISGAVLDLVINLILIPTLGGTGAAIGTLAAEILVFIVQMLMLGKESSGIFSDVSIWKIIAAVAVGTLMCSWVKLLSLPAFPALALSAVFFFVSYAAMLLIMKEKLLSGLAAELLGRRK